MRYHDDDSFTGLDQAKRGQAAPGPRGTWRGTTRQRLATAEGRPNAVFKISSYSHSGGAVASRLEYIGREGELELEGPNGDLIRQAELGELVADWCADAGGGNRSVLAMSAMVAFPVGVDEAQATEAARQFFRDAFGDNHDYAFAPHTDAAHFHVHVVVQAAGHDGTQLRIDKAEIQALRELFAEKALEQGIELDASPRAARGLDPLQQPEREIEGMLRRGATPAAWPEAARIALEGWAAGQRRAERGADPSVTATEARAYAVAAAELGSEIPALKSDKEKSQAIQGAMQLAALGWELAEQAEAKIGKTPDVERAKDITVAVERECRDLVPYIDHPQEKKAAIQARQRLGTQERFKEYRQEKREQAEQKRELEKGKDKGAELELDPFD